MNSLPTELNLKVLHHVRDSTSTVEFNSDAVTSMRQASAYNEFLLLMALYHRHWTALAQSELFHHIILENDNRTRLLLKLLRKRGNGVLRTYAEKASSMRLGYYSDFDQHNEELKEHLDELAEYCPNIVEISCACVNTKFSYFQNIKRLDRLNFYEGSQAGPGSSSLSITRLSVQYGELSEPLAPISFPFLSHLFLDCLSDNSLQLVLPLTPQIKSLSIGKLCSTSQINRIISASTSLTTISIRPSDFAYLDDGSCNVIKERLEVVSVRAGYFLDFSKLSECITASKVLKKVILNGLALTTGSGQTTRIAELKIVVEACKKKKSVELWKENFTVNGKVDLNADVATSFDLA